MNELNKVMRKKQFIRICPDCDVLYDDADTCCSNGFGDEIENDELDLGPRFSFVIPGIKEWLQRYEDATDFADTTTDPSFDWVTWHYEGLCFAKAIWKQLPRSYSLFYSPPYEDNSHTITDLEIDESIDSVIKELSSKADKSPKEPSFKNKVDFIAECKEQMVSVLFQVNLRKVEVNIRNEGLQDVKDWLKRITEAKEEIYRLWLSKYTLFYFRQMVGSHLDMGQLWIVDSASKEPRFQAYVKTEEFVNDFYACLQKIKC